jgi:hypothetical protein
LVDYSFQFPTGRGRDIPQSRRRRQIRHHHGIDYRYDNAAIFFTHGYVAWQKERHVDVGLESGRGGR